jgi:head-tail adaptor
MLRLSMTVQNPVRTVDSVGQAEVSWLSVAQIACHIDSARTNEVIGDLGVNARSDWRILAAWHPAVTTNSRLLYLDNGTERVFNIRVCFDRDQKRRRLEIEATEEVE